MSDRPRGGRPRTLPAAMSSPPVLWVDGLFLTPNGEAKPRRPLIREAILLESLSLSGDSRGRGRSQNVLGSPPFRQNHTHIRRVSLTSYPHDALAWRALESGPC